MGIEDIGGAGGAGDDSGPDTSSMSDDEILNLGNDEGGDSSAGAPNAESSEGEGSAPPATPVVATAEGDKPAEPAKPEGEQKAEEEWLDPAEVPEQFNPIFKKHPELKEAFYRGKAYDKLFTGGVTEARAVRQIYPTLKDAQEAAGIAASALQFRGSMRNADDFISFVGRTEPKALERLVAGFSEAVGRGAPAQFRQLSEPVWKSTLDSLERMAREKGDEDTLEVANAMREVLGLKPQGAKGEESRDPEYLAWKRGQAENDRKAREGDPEQFTRFGAEVDRTYSEKLNGSIMADVDKLAPLFTPAAKREILEKVSKSVNATLAANKFLESQLENKFRSGTLDGAHRDEVAAFIFDRAKLLASQETRKIVTYYSKEVFRSEEADRGRRLKSAGSRDPGAANPGHGTPSTAPAQQSNRPMRELTRGLSDDDILNGRTRATR